MPQIGEIRYGREIGKENRGKYIWCACIDCGKERWVYLSFHKKSESKRCHSCNGRKTTLGRFGKRANNWQGGRIRDENGYILVKLTPDDFFYPMTDRRGYVREHRLVMAKHLGRCLHMWEIVHHKKGVAKDDSRIEGLQLVSEDRHNQITILENRIRLLEQRVLQLEVENIALKVGW